MSRTPSEEAPCPRFRSLALCGLAATGAAALTLPGAAGAAVHRHPGVHTITVVEHAITDTEQRAVPGGP